jgi:ABC-type branched-subunit amino acid transport system substrate-binding protein
LILSVIVMTNKNRSKLSLGLKPHLSRFEAKDLRKNPEYVRGRTLLRYATPAAMILVFSLFTLGGCSTAKKGIPAPKPNKPFPEAIKKNPSPDTIVSTPIIVDTIQWVIKEEPIKLEDIDPKLDNDAADLLFFSDLQHYYKKIYKVAVVLPFFADSDRITPNNRVASWSFDFYTGFKLALQKSNHKDFQIVVDVFDSKASETRVKSLIQSGKFDNVDVIIGPYRSDIAPLLADFVKDKSTMLISPYIARYDQAKYNLNVLQANPSLEQHIKALFSHAVLTKNKEDKVFLLVAKGKDEDDRLALWSKLKATRPLRDSAQFAILRFNPENLVIDDFFLDSISNPQDEIHFIVPFWEEATVNTLVRKLAAEKGLRTMKVYGLPQWQNFERLPSSELNALNVHLSSVGYYDRSKQSQRTLAREYMDTYISPFGNDQYWGYQMGKLLIERFQKDGAMFQRFFPMDSNITVEETTFDFRFTRLSKDSMLLIENQKINIIAYRDGRYEVVY